MTYYKAIPLWKDNSRNNVLYGCGPVRFVGNNEIVNQKFDSIEEALIAAKNDGTCLRPKNWEFSKHSGIFSRHKTIISVEWLYQNGYLSEKIDSDNISKIYNFK